MEMRVLGKTGESLSVIGFGGIVVMQAQQSVADKHVADAVSSGVCYFDVAPSYGDAESRLGPALKPYREAVFLACKTNDRSAQGAKLELHNSLRNLRTDRFDLYQLHAMTSEDDLKAVTAPGGALETLAEAKREGLTRFVGFSAHSEDIALRLMDEFEFDTILFPLNWVCYLRDGMGSRVVEKAAAKGMGILALKSMAMSPWEEGEERRYAKTWYKPNDDVDLARMALRFTLSLPVTAVIPPGEADLLHLALELEERGELRLPLSQEERAALVKLASQKVPIFAR